MPEFNLYNGVSIPDLCYGTSIVYLYRYGETNFARRANYWLKNCIKNRPQIKLDISAPKAIKSAMENDIRCFDTSRAYGGAEYVLGKVLKKYDRNKYFVITKLRNKDQFQGNIREAFEKSLSELGMEYVDLYLMHWPVTDLYVKNWKVLEQLYDEGLCKAIGVCNCNIHHLKEIGATANIKPMVNQFECHPLFTQDELRNYCNENDIQVMAYTPTGRMDQRLNKTVLVSIAQQYKKSVAQIILRWHQQIGNIPVVNSSNSKHVIENSEIYDFELNNDEINQILKININSRLRYDPDNCDFRKL